MVILKMVFLFTISLPELYPVSVLQNFIECFINWMRDCHSSDDKDVMAIDGKTLRHSYDKSRRKGTIYVIKIRLHIICDVPDELIDFTFEWKELKNYAWQSPFVQ